MPKNVLIVDDDRVLLRFFKQQFEKYKKIISILSAENGLDAIKVLKRQTISLVVTDLEMPKMDGFALLAYLTINYPDIPVIIMTAYNASPSKKAMIKEGSAGYFEKPFPIEDLARKILLILKKSSEGGSLNSISSEMFIQLIELEQKTCTIRVVDKNSRKLGVLFFRNGDLLNARINTLMGNRAAYEIFSWDKVTLSIENVCPMMKKQIKGDLQGILLEAMRLKDEAGEGSNIFLEENELGDIVSEDSEFAEADIQMSDGLSIANVRDKIEKAIGIENIYLDAAWNDLLVNAQSIGDSFNCGTLKVCYIEKKKGGSLIVLPGSQPAVISVNSKFPRIRILEALSED